MLDFDIAPPHSDEAEQAVLGSVMLDNDALPAVAGMLVADDFYQPVHRSIWCVIQDLAAAGRAADPLTVMDRGGFEFKHLNDLMQSAPTARAVRSYAAIVKERARRRALMKIGADLADAALRGAEGGAGGVDALLDGAVSALMALQGGSTRWAPVPMEALLAPFVERLEARAAGKIDCIDTGMPDLDRLLGGGLRDGELFVLGARPSMGKSAWVLQVARHVAQAWGVLVCSQEDSADMLVMRQVAAAGRVNLAHLRLPDRAPHSMWSGVADGVDALRPIHLLVDEQPALALRDVRRKVTEAVQHMRQARRPRLRLVVVDYLQLMAGEAETRALELGRIAAGLKGLATEFGVAVVLLSQLSRKADETDAPPRMDHLKESGGIEEAADVVGLLWRQARRNLTEENKHHAQIEIAKQKGGATDTVHLFFDGATQRFEAWDGPPPRRGGRGG